MTDLWIRGDSARELHLFAGIGGGILGGLLLGHTPVCAVEIDPYCRQVLLARQADGCLPKFPVYHSVRLGDLVQRGLFDDPGQFIPGEWRGRVDIVCGGFPCQPWSVAGNRKGADDPRHLWPQMAAIVESIRPRFVFCENVSIAAFREPYDDLRRMGYRVPPAICLAAEDVGAPHRRKRWWLLAADADGDQLRAQQGRCEPGRAGSSEPVDDGGTQPVADANGWRLEVQRLPQSAGIKGARGRQPDRRGKAREQLDAKKVFGGPSDGRPWWAVEPRVGRVAHGVPSRVDRLRALGNAQVPAVAAAAFLELMGRL